MKQKVKEGGKKGISINMLVFILGILVCASLLTYIIPAGQFDVNPDTKALIPGTYHGVEQTPVNLWKALLNIFTGMTNSAKVMSIVIFMGGALKVIISTGAVEEFLNWAIYKLQKKGIAVIVPLMVILFSILSAYGGERLVLRVHRDRGLGGGQDGPGPDRGHGYDLLCHQRRLCGSAKGQDAGGPGDCRGAPLFGRRVENRVAVRDHRPGGGLRAVVLLPGQKEPGKDLYGQHGLDRGRAPGRYQKGAV